jgi:hypothetical protein
MQCSSEYGLCARQARRALEARRLAAREAGQAQLCQARKSPPLPMPGRTVRPGAPGGAAAVTGSSGAAQTHSQIQDTDDAARPPCPNAPSRYRAGTHTGAGACRTCACPLHPTLAQHAGRSPQGTAQGPHPLGSSASASSASASSYWLPLLAGRAHACAGGRSPAAPAPTGACAASAGRCLRRATGTSQLRLPDCAAGRPGASVSWLRLGPAPASSSGAL